MGNGNTGFGGIDTGAYVQRAAGTADLVTAPLRYVNVQDYAGAPSATVDAYTQIAAAAAEASTLGIPLYFPGTYRTSKPLTPAADAIWVGPSQYTPALTVEPTDYPNFSYDYIVNCTNSDVTLIDFAVDGQKRNGTNPANECGGIQVGPNTMLIRCRVDDPNMFGYWIGSTATQVRMIDCRSARGGNNDAIGGGGGNDVKIIRHVWEATTAGNRFDNVNGTGVELIECVDLSTNSGGIYFEGMVASGAKSCSLFGATGITIQSDGSYSPATVTNPLRCFAVDNDIPAGNNGIELSYYGGATAQNKGGYNQITGNRIDGVTGNGVGMIGPNPCSNACYGGDQITGNQIRNPNASGGTTWNPGTGTSPYSGVNILQGYKVKVRGNTIIDDRATHLMNYAISLGGGSGGGTNGVEVAGNTCAGSTYQGGGSPGEINLNNATSVASYIHDNDLPTGIQGTADTTTVIRNNVGYNPVGSVTVAVPASGTAVSAAVYDRTFYVSTVSGTTACSMAVQNGPTVTFVGSVAQVVPVRVPAGQTLTPTYTGTAPTWVVEGE